MIIESASPFVTLHGRRVELTAIKAPLLSQFLGGFLSQVPNVAAARSYVIDANGNVVGSPGADARGRCTASGSSAGRGRGKASAGLL